MKNPREFKSLLKPVQVGMLALKNRIVLPAMTTSFANRDGSITRRLVSCYMASAHGCIGLIIVDPACVDYLCRKGLINQVDISSEDTLEGFSNLTRGRAHRALAAPRRQLAASGQTIALTPGAPFKTAYRGFDINSNEFREGGGTVADS
jgi:2,4-dienoyl-CoA reductase-like NADH-dependent reductase (Old Yellow Enzyme family)